MRVQIAKEKGQFSAVVRAIQQHWQYASAFAAKGVVQSPIRQAAEGIIQCAKQAQSRNPESLERMRCGLSAGKGMLGVHSAGKV